MTNTDEVETVRVAVVGDRKPGFVPQEAIAEALSHSAASLGINVETTWYPTPILLGRAADALAGADAVWCAPGSPFQSLDGALEGLRFAREQGTPLLGTCAGFQHGVIEIARNGLGRGSAHHAEYGADPEGKELFIDELLCSLVGQAMSVALVDPDIRGIYGTDRVTEQYYCRFGLAESFRPLLAQAGLVVAGVDVADGGTRIMRLEGHPWYVLTLFVPQVRSEPGRPHPLITAFVRAGAMRATATRVSAP